jgi:hypothetical protein
MLVLRHKKTLIRIIAQITAMVAQKRSHSRPLWGVEDRASRL